MRAGGGRVKGSKFELEIAKRIAEWCGFKYGTQIRRTPNSGALITRADIWVNPRVRNIFPYFVEMKNRQGWTLEGIQNKKWPPYEWFTEAAKKLPEDPDYDPKSPVILIFKRNGVKPLVMMASDLASSIAENFYYETEYMMENHSRGIAIVSFDDFLKLFIKEVIEE